MCSLNPDTSKTFSKTLWIAESNALAKSVKTTSTSERCLKTLNTKLLKTKCT